MTFVGFLLCLLLLPPEPASSRKNAGFKEVALIPYLKLIKRPSNLSLFIFRLCFTICIGITWTFVPLLASTRLGLSSSAIGVVVMINVLIAGLLQAPMGMLADRYSKKFLVTAGGVLGIISVLSLNVKQGTCLKVVSSCIPPLSVSTYLQVLISF